MEGGGIGVFVSVAVAVAHGVTLSQGSNERGDIHLGVRCLMAAGLATTVEELDAEYLTRVLAVDGARVTSVEATRIGTGQVALSLLLELTWDVDDAELPRRLVAKIPAVEEASRQAAAMHRTYELEADFYADLSGLVEVPHPRCRHVVFDAGSGAFTLIMEVAPGEVGDQLAGCSPLAAEAIVDGAVGLHAPTWGRAEELLSHGWLTRPDAATLEMRVGAYRHLLPGFVERFSGRLGSEVIDAARWLGERLVDVALAYRSPMCLVHGDFRLDNMLFDPSASASSGAVSVTVVDWQTVGLGRGAVDVAYGLGSGLPPEDRRRVESALVDRYVAGLSAHGVTGGEVADGVRHDYRLGSTSGLAMSVIASQLVASTPRGDEMFAVMAERHAAQMFDNEIADLVGG